MNENEGEIHKRRKRERRQSLWQVEKQGIIVKKKIDRGEGGGWRSEERSR